ncbi:RecB family nuclease, putative [Halothece sp. PCC 7418]|uniref:TM0106 family RecB-like putative nuclease n=1 Tax=Halothece sp. (strain PCC 7418) TaxID=65093 RepID=UPI0002A06413|nr:TM0106 family RecB-like putative nuclease [Halothece sp. PCC 7418]AFZ43206.1 RecB family nuclease, putative [Halothece sp. PCC 7418]
MLISDVVLLDYKRCNRRPFLNFYGDSSQQDAQREFLLKLREENRKQVLEILGNTPYHQPETSVEYWEESGKETLTLMEQGVECILNGVLWQTGLAGWDLPFSGLKTVTLLASPSLLVKQPGSSIFGDWQYEAVSIRLGRRPKPEYKLVSAFQAKLLALIQGSELVNPRLMVKSGSEYNINLSTWIERMEEVLVAILEMLLFQQEPEVFISRQRCNLCQWQTFCYNIAQDQEHLSLLPGVTPSRYEVLQKLGLTNLEKLAQGDSFLLAQELGKEIAFDLKKQALATFYQKPLLKLGSPASVLETIPSARREIYFDIEAEPERNLDYLLGVLIVDYQDKTETFYPLIAETPEQEAEIWEQFLDLVFLDPQAPIFHYSKYEAETIRRLAGLYRTSRKQEQLLLKRLVDLHDRVTRFLILPTENYSLKTIAQWLGFQWRETGVSGEQCVCWYDQWLKTRDRALLDTIIRYNEDDCRATYELKSWLVKFLSFHDPKTEQLLHQI